MAWSSWTPVMKAVFPLPTAEAAKVLEALRLPVPTPLRAGYTLDEFIGQFAAAGGAIRAVKVHKRRTPLTVGGCMAELCEYGGKAAFVIGWPAAAIIQRCGTIVIGRSPQ